MSRIPGPRLPVVLFAAHLGALIFGLIGILIMLPNPDLWAHDPNAVRVFNWSMEHAGAVHILLGAATMLVFGIIAFGARATLIFFAISCGLSLTSELVGTGTGWPFGNYEYTDFLGYKVLDRVPYTIPLSWFYMGFASLILATAIARRYGWRRQALWSVLLGVWLLTVWDLVLDPAMAHESLRVQFWEWSQSGPYFGMPAKNFVGWSVTALVFMGVSRWLWRGDLKTERTPLLVPFAVYAANMAFAMVLSAGVGLWWPILLAALLGLLPALLAVARRRPSLPTELRWAPDG